MSVAGGSELADQFSVKQSTEVAKEHQEADAVVAVCLGEDRLEGGGLAEAESHHWPLQ